MDFNQENSSLNKFKRFEQRLSNFNKYILNNKESPDL